MKRKFLMSAMVLVLVECAGWHALWLSAKPHGGELGLLAAMVHATSGFLAAWTWDTTETKTP